MTTRQNGFIALPQALDGELQTAKAIAFVRIGASKIKQDIGVVRAEHEVERPREREQVRLVACAIFELDVEVAHFFLEWEILGSVQRQREHISVAAENR